MTGCSVGRSVQKYKGGASDLSSILEDPGDIIYADSTVEAENLAIGSTDGHVLTIINSITGELGWQAAPGASGVGTLQTVTNNGATTTNSIQFQNAVTSLSASGNVVIAGNVTATNYIGSGESLHTIPASNLTGSVPNDFITLGTHTTGNYVLTITGGDGITVTGSVGEGWTPTLAVDPKTNGGLVFENNKLAIDLGATNITGTLGIADGGTGLTSVGSAGQVLKVNSGATGLEWADDLNSGGSGGSSVFQVDGTKAFYTDGPVGISNVSALTTQTLQIGGNVAVNDTADDKLSVTGNAYVSKNLRVIDEISAFRITTYDLEVRKAEVVSARPTQIINI